MKKYLALIIAFLFFLSPINAFALSKDYVDKVADIIGAEKKDDQVNLYLFYGEECPHCEEEREWLKSIKKVSKESRSF